MDELEFLPELENVVLQEADATHFDNGDGTITAMFSSGMNYLRDGEWKNGDYYYLEEVSPLHWTNNSDELPVSINNGLVTCPQGTWKVLGLYVGETPIWKPDWTQYIKQGDLLWIDAPWGKLQYKITPWGYREEFIFDKNPVAGLLVDGDLIVKYEGSIDTTVWARDASNREYNVMTANNQKSLARQDLYRAKYPLVLDPALEPSGNARANDLDQVFPWESEFAIGTAEFGGSLDPTYVNSAACISFDISSLLALSITSSTLSLYGRLGNLGTLVSILGLDVVNPEQYTSGLYDKIITGTPIANVDTFGSGQVYSTPTTLTSPALLSYISGRKNTQASFGLFTSSTGKTIASRSYANSTYRPSLSVTYTAATTYTASFDSKGGSAVSPQTKVAGAFITEPSNPTKNGYTFGGWFEDDGTFANPWVFASETMPASNKTLYAKWIPGPYSITWSATDSNLSSQTTTQVYAANLILPTQPTRTGYVFVGWFTASSGGSQVTAATPYNTTGTTTYYARWTLAAPSSLTVDAYNAGSDSINLSWPSFADATDYKAYYSTNAGSTWTLVPGTVSGTTTKTISHVAPPYGSILYGATYLVGATESPMVTAAGNCTRALDILSAKRVSNTQTYVYFDQDVAANALIPANWTVGSSLAISNITKISAVSPYYILITHAYQDEVTEYPVAAANVTGAGGEPLGTSSATIAALTKLPKPSVSVSPWSSATDSIDMTFIANTKLQKKFNAGAWEDVSISASATSYSHSNVASGTHTYRVKTLGDFDTTFDSEWSDEIEIIPVMVKPTLVAALSADGNDIVTLTPSSTDTVDSWSYYQDNVLIGTSTPQLTSPGTYSYEAVAHRGNISSARADAQTIIAATPTTPVLEQPTYSITTGKTTLRWSDTAAEKGYQIEYYVENNNWQDVNPAILYEADIDELEYEHTAFSGTTVYRVRSKNNVGVSEWSNYKAILVSPVSLKLSNVDSPTINGEEGKSLVNSISGDIQVGQIEWSSAPLWNATDNPDGLHLDLQFEARLMKKIGGATEAEITPWTVVKNRLKTDVSLSGLDSVSLNFSDPETGFGDAVWLEIRIVALETERASQSFLLPINPITSGAGSLTISLYTQRADIPTSMIDTNYGDDPFVLPVTYGYIKYGSVAYSSDIIFDIPAIAAPVLAGATYDAVNHHTDLIWSLVPNTSSYSVEYGETNNGIFGGWNQLVELSNSINTYQHTYTPGVRTQTSYRVIALGDHSMYKDSPASNSFFVDTKPLAPTGVNGAYDLGNDHIDLSLTNVTGALSYQWYYERLAAKNPDDILTTDVAENLIVARKAISLTNGTYTIPDVENGTVTFCVEVTTKGGTSEKSATIDVDTRAAKPVISSAVYSTVNNNIVLNVTPVAGATEYYWYHEDSAATKHYQIVTVSPTLTIANPRYGNHLFWVVAKTTGGRGPYSEMVSAECTRTLKIVSGARKSLSTTEITFNSALVKATAETKANWSLAGLTINSIAVQTDTKKVLISHSEATMAGYEITASNFLGALDEPLDTVGKTFTMADMVALQPPVWTQNITNYLISSDRVSLRWSNPNAAGLVKEYAIERRVNGLEWAYLTSKFDENSFNHSDINPPAGLLEYRIFARGNGYDVGWSAYSDPITSITPTIPAPTITITPNLAEANVLLSATSGSNTGLTYRYYRSYTFNGIEQEKVLLVGNLDTITEALQHNYYATARTMNIVSGFSEAAVLIPEIPDAPTLVSAVYNIAQNMNIVTWSDVDSESGYRLERNANLANPAGWTVIADTDANVTSFQDLNPSSNEEYNYRVQARHSVYGNSEYSNIITMRPSIPAPTLESSIDNETGLVTLVATPPNGITIQSYSFFYDKNNTRIQVAAGSSSNTIQHQLTTSEFGTQTYYVKATYANVTSGDSLPSTVIAAKPNPPVISSIDSLYKDLGYIGINLDRLGDIYRWKDGVATKIASGAYSYIDTLPAEVDGAFSYSTKSTETNYFGQSAHSALSTVTLTQKTPSVYFLTGDNNEIFGFNQTLRERQEFVDMGLLDPSELYPEKVLTSKASSPGKFWIEVVANGPDEGRVVLGISEVITANQSGKFLVPCNVALTRIESLGALYAEFFSVEEGSEEPTVRFRSNSAGSTYLASKWVFLLDIDIRESSNIYSTILCHGIQDDPEYSSGVRGITISQISLPNPPILSSSSNISIQLGKATIDFDAVPDASSYYLYRSKDGGSYLQRSQPITSLRFTDLLGIETDDLPHTYSYQVKAANDLGFSRASNTKSFVYQKPGQPVVTKTDPSYSDGAFTFSISGTAGGAVTNYKIFKNGAEVADKTASSNTFPYTTIYQNNKTNGSIDTYSIVAYNGAGPSIPSDEINITNAPPAVPLLEVIGSSDFSPVNLETGDVILKATPTDLKVAGYLFYKKVGINGTWTALNTIPQLGMTYTDRISTQGNYYYKVSATNVVGSSETSLETLVTAPIPTDISFAANFSERTGWVTLSASASNANSIVFFRRDAVTGLTANLGSGSEGIKLDAPPKVGLWVYYCSISNMFGSILSPEISVYTKWSGQLRAYQDGTEVLFGVKATPIIFKKKDVATRVNLACTEKGMTDRPIVINTINPYKVSASADGPWTNQASLGVLNSLPTPVFFLQSEALSTSVEVPMVLGDMEDYSVIFDTSLGAITSLLTTVMGMSQIKLNWNSAFNAVGYQVWYRSASFEWSLLIEVSGKDTLEYLATSLSSGTEYQFKVRAVGEQTYGDFSSDVTAKTTKPIDTTPPTTTISGNSSNWVKTGLITLSAADDLNGSGVDKTYYKINNGTTLTYNGPVTVNTQNLVTFSYWSTDQAGNVEAEKSATLKIDSQGPVIVIQPAVEITGGKTIDAVITDAVSGVASRQYQIDGGAWNTGTLATITAVGAHSVNWQAYDVAGNLSTASANVIVTSSVPIKTIVPMYEESFETLTTPLPAATTRNISDPLSISKTWGTSTGLSIAAPGLNGSGKALYVPATTAVNTFLVWDRDLLKISFRLKLAGTPLAASVVNPIGTVFTTGVRPFMCQPYGTTGVNPSNVTALPPNCTLDPTSGLYKDSTTGYLWEPTAAGQVGVQYSQPGIAANPAAQLAGFGIVGGRWVLATSSIWSPGANVVSVSRSAGVSSLILTNTTSLKVGYTLVVSSCSDTTFNGSLVITSISGNTITCNQALGDVALKNATGVATVNGYGWVDIGAPPVEVGVEYLYELEINAKAVLGKSFVGADGKTYSEFMRMIPKINGIAYHPNGGLGYVGEEIASGNYGGWMAGTWAGSGTRYLRKFLFTSSGAANNSSVIDDIKFETEVIS